MKKPKTIKLSDFLSTELGAKYLSRIKDYIFELGDKPCQECAYRFACADAAYSFLVSAASESDSNDNYELDGSILYATVDELFACFDSWLDSEFCGHIMDDESYSSLLEKMSILLNWSIDAETGIPWSEHE